MMKGNQPPVLPVLQGAPVEDPDDYFAGYPELLEAANPPRQATAGRWADELRPSRIDWAEMWASEPLVTDWLLEPVIARGRSHAQFAPGKAGKSLFALDGAAALATGRPWLDRPAGDPRSVLYLDLEMTLDDVHERLGDLGYGPRDDLDRLYYHLLPALPPLDHPEGGAAVAELVASYGVDLVVVDTLARVVAGPENDADTYRKMFLHTGAVVKRAGVALWRLDHAGKDLDRGQRGSSAKADDVDVVWRLTPRDANRLSLRATHRRMAWVPEVIELERRVDPLRHVRVGDSWPAGTTEMAGLLDDLEVPLSAGRRPAADALKAAGHASRAEVVNAAQRWRRARPPEPS